MHLRIWQNAQKGGLNTPNPLSCQRIYINKAGKRCFASFLSTGATENEQGQIPNLFIKRIKGGQRYLRYIQKVYTYTL